MSNGLLRCQWSINDETNIKIMSDYKLELSIRIYDITNGETKEKSTCVMKETIVNIKTSEYFLKTPITHGRMLLELGYRKH